MSVTSWGLSDTEDIQASQVMEARPPALTSMYRVLIAKYNVFLWSACSKA